MKLLKLIKNERGAVTPFLVIVLATFVWLFTITYSHYLSRSQDLSKRRLLNIASDDLLAGFNPSLLKDYGLLAYRADKALDEIETSIGLNQIENQDNRFLKSDKVLVLSDDISYEVLSTLNNRQTLADTCVDIAHIHMPKEIIEELSTLYKWREKVEDKARAYEKVDKVMKEMQGLQARVSDYHKYIEKVNDLGGYSLSWYQSTDTGRAGNALRRLQAHHKKSLKALKGFEKGLLKAKTYYDLAQDIEDDQLGSLLSTLSFDIEDYHDYFSEEASMDELIGRLEANLETIEVLLDEDDFDGLETLDTDFWMGEKRRGESGWLRFLENLESQFASFHLSSGDLFAGVWAEEARGKETIVLTPYEHQALNEYFLSVLKSTVSVEVRDFPILTREDRATTFENGEIEYLITGKPNSQYEMAGKLFGLRMASNVIYLLGDREKFNVAKTGGYALCGWFPGGGPIGTVLVISAWAGVESVHDLSLLKMAKGVPFIKTDASWYWELDIDSLSKRENTNYTEDRKEALDQYYNDYLRILLSLTPVDKKIDRYIKLVNKNMRASGHKGFRLEDMVTDHRVGWQRHSIEGGYYEGGH